MLNVVLFRSANEMRKSIRVKMSIFHFKFQLDQIHKCLNSRKVSRSFYDLIRSDFLDGGEEEEINRTHNPSEILFIFFHQLGIREIEKKIKN